MNPERWQQISRIFKSAIDLDISARSEYVKERCGTDDDLREEVERLIESHEQAEDKGFIGGHAVEEAGELFTDEQRPSLQKDQQFGSYLILDHLGTGGMGEVYRAQDSRLDRTVALKILSPDLAGVSIDSDFHYGSAGIDVLQRTSAFSGSVTLPSLPSGPHKLVLLSSDGQNAGVQVIPFTVP